MHEGLATEVGRIMLQCDNAGGLRLNRQEQVTRKNAVSDQRVELSKDVGEPLLCLPEITAQAREEVVCAPRTAWGRSKCVVSVPANA